jgi:hypothetical protein
MKERDPVFRDKLSGCRLFPSLRDILARAPLLSLAQSTRSFMANFFELVGGLQEVDEVLGADLSRLIAYAAPNGLG